MCATCWPIQCAKCMGWKPRDDIVMVVAGDSEIPLCVRCAGPRLRRD